MEHGYLHARCAATSLSCLLARVRSCTGKHVTKQSLHAAERLADESGKFWTSCMQTHNHAGAHSTRQLMKQSKTIQGMPGQGRGSTPIH